MQCADTAKLAGKHLLFLSIDTFSWTIAQFVAAARFARANDVDSLVLKFADGGNVWYGGINGYRRIRDAIKAEGVGVIPYMFSYGDAYGFLNGEIALLIEYMTEDGIVCADMEEQWNGQAAWAAHMNARLQGVPGRFLVSTWADPFLQNWKQVIKNLNSRVDAYLPQQYTNYLASAWGQFSELGAACLFPTIDLTQEYGPNDPVANARAAHTQGHVAIAVWYYGSALNNPALLHSVFQAFPK